MPYLKPVPLTRKQRLAIAARVDRVNRLITEAHDVESSAPPTIDWAKAKSTLTGIKRHDHRQSLWILGSAQVGSWLWCYRCGAIRANAAGREHKWTRTTGLDGKNPAA